MRSQKKYAIKTIKEINSLSDIDFVVFGGDNLRSAKIENLNLFLHFLRKVNKKPYVLLGSNDVLSSNGIDKNFYMKKVRRALWYHHSAKPNYTFKYNGTLFIAMDGSKQYFQSTNGYYSNDELLWLKNTLDKHKNENIVILQHYPLLSTKSSWLQTAKTEAYEDLIKNYPNIKAIISAHYDQNIEIKKDNIFHILNRDYSKTLGYKIISFDFEKDDEIITFLIK